MYKQQQNAMSYKPLKNFDRFNPGYQFQNVEYGIGHKDLSQGTHQKSVQMWFSATCPAANTKFAM